MKTELHILKAYHGDCFLVKTFDSEKKAFNILIDGGPAKTFKYTLRKELEEIQVIHLLILTHIDDDHINGILRFLESSSFERLRVEKYWINNPDLIRLSHGSNISYMQDYELGQLLLEKKEPKAKFSESILFSLQPKEIRGVRFDILSPTEHILTELWKKRDKLFPRKLPQLEEEDVSGKRPLPADKKSLELLAKEKFKPSKTLNADLINSASIAFLLTLFDCTILFLADSRPEIIEASLRKMGYSEKKPLQVDYIKVSHHGSKNNTSNEVLDLIDCNNFIISTNGGIGRSKHPNREVVARILHHPKRKYENTRTIYLNYLLNEIETKTGKLLFDEDFENANWVLKGGVNTIII